MPKYKLPPEKKNSRNSGLSMPAGESLDYDRRVRIPVNAEIIEAVGVKDKVDITLTGTIEEAVRREGKNHKECHITVNLSMVEAYPEGNNNKAFNKGFNKTQKAKSY